MVIPCTGIPVPAEWYLMLLSRGFKQSPHVWPVNPERGRQLLCWSEIGSHFASGEYFELRILIQAAEGGGCMAVSKTRMSR